MYSGNTTQVVTGVLSRAFPRSLKVNTIFAAAKTNGLMYMLTGLHKDRALPVEKNREGFFSLKSERMQVMPSYEFEFYITAVHPPAQTIRNGQDEVSLIVPSYNPNQFATLKGYQTHFNKAIQIPNSEIEKAVNRPNGGESVADRHMKLHAQGTADSISQMLWDNANQSETTIGGIPFMVDNNNTYFLDRSADENAFWRSEYVAGGGAMNDLDPIMQLQTNILTNGGMADLVCVNNTVFFWIRKRLESIGNLATWNGEIKFGGDLLEYGPSRICLDRNVPLDGSSTQQAYVLSTDKFMIYTTDKPDSTGFQPAGWLNNAHQATEDWYFGIACTKPNEQGWIDGLSAPA